MSKSIPRLCECNGFNCACKVDLPLDEAIEVEKSGLVLIVKGCKIGPNPTDRFIKERSGYSLYKKVS